MLRDVELVLLGVVLGMGLTLLLEYIALPLVWRVGHRQRFW